MDGFLGYRCLSCNHSQTRVGQQREDRVGAGYSGRWQFIKTRITNVDYQMTLDDLVEIVICRISDNLRYPEVIISHVPIGQHQKLTVTDKNGKVFSIEIKELED